MIPGLWLAASLTIAQVTPSIPVGSKPVARLAANERKRSVLTEIDTRIRESMHAYYGQQWIPRLRADRAKLPPDAPLDAIWDLDMNLADWLLREGEIDEALKVLDRLVAAFNQMPTPGTRRAIPLIKKLVVANLRRAEQANCVCQRGEESCVFPLRDTAVHIDRTGAEAAVALLEQALEFDPGDLQCVWLLNFAHMALGTYPDGVPPLHRIPPERLESEYDIGWFDDIASRVGITRRSCAGGAVMDDFDGDGDLDVIVSSMEPSTPMAYYRNRGDGGFDDVSAETEIDAQIGALNFVHGDVDGDGRLDLYVPRGAWMAKSGEVPHSLLRQLPDGRFLDVTAQAGVELAIPSQVAAFADVDVDGDLDLFVGGESVRSRTGWIYSSHLFANDGSARFTDVTKTAGVANDSFCKGAAFGDYDADGLPDLYVSNFGPNRLYHNEGKTVFVDRGPELGVAEPISSFATWWFDADNDGWLDLFVTSYAGRDRDSEVAAYYKNRTTGTDCSRLFVNREGKGFRDASIEMGLNRAFFPMGANFGDFDNDGYQDMYLGTGDPDFTSLWPNVALRNDGGKRFQDVTASGGFGHLQKGHGVAFGDIDRDGDQDLMVQVGGAYRDDAFYDVLYHNPGHGNHSTTVRLRGVASNRFAIGARLRVRIAEAGKERDVYAWVGSGGSFGGNSLQAEIGLGQAERIVALEVRWPKGSVELFDEVPLDRVIAITEGEGRLTVVPSEPIRMPEVENP